MKKIFTLLFLIVLSSCAFAQKASKDAILVFSKTKGSAVKTDLGLTPPKMPLCLQPTTLKNTKLLCF